MRRDVDEHGAIFANTLRCFATGEMPSPSHLCYIGVYKTLCYLISSANNNDCWISRSL